MIGETLGHYQFQERIGEGGMGVVYRAEDTHLERHVAIKVLSPDKIADRDHRQRIRREALTLSRLNHPNVQTVHDFDTQNGIDFLVSELIEGRSLEEHLATGPLPEAEVRRLGEQLARGLAAAHDQGIVHRDISPANLRVTLDDHLKILDFGIARTRSTPARSSKTETLDLEHSISGTVPYMAPEQLRGETATPAVDVYAAGVVLYEMATGQRPFPESTFADLVDAVLNRTPRSPRDLNPEISWDLSEVILAALAKDPAERPRDGNELANRLLPGRGARSRRSPLRWVSGVAVGLLGAATLFMGLSSWAGAAGGTGGVEALAVLPLKTFDDADASHAAALSDSLVTELAALELFAVVSATTSLRAIPQAAVQSLARDLGVDALLEGSVQIDGDGALISVRLVDGTTDRSLWARTYPIAIDSVSARRELAGRIATDVRAWLQPGS